MREIPFLVNQVMDKACGDVTISPALFIRGVVDSCFFLLFHVDFRLMLLFCQATYAYQGYFCGEGRALTGGISVHILKKSTSIN
ncbi:hypothetical protein [Paenibacillus sp. FSL H8-0332]|uniref:hypothetical protein n=1 Tax=Paenibacillus sp. FSL H8-0332 TaxID=2954742 RepID=UPI0030CC2DE0